MSTILFNPIGPPFDFSVSGGSSGPVNDLSGNTGTANPVGGNINVVGPGIASSGISTAGNIYTVASGDTVTINETQAQFITNYTATSSNTYVALATDYYISVDASGGIKTVQIPNAPTTGRLFVIKDRNGNAAMNNVSITTPGGTVTIDGVTTYLLDAAYEAATLVFNGTNYEVF